MEDGRWRMEDSLLFEKKQKVMFIFLAQEKGTKRTSTLTHPLPIWRGSNSELQKPTVLRAFWYRGTTRWEMRETPSVPLFRGKIGMREEGYKFQGSGQLWLMVQGSRLRVNSGAWFRVNGFLAKRGFAF